ncbi:MAG: hypothetical protein ACYC3I_27620 [Gemmataceae bacterium]
MSTKHRRPSFRIGDRVRVDMGRRKLTGVIVEDLGPLGVQGRRLFQVDFPMDPDDPMSMMLPEDEMELIPPEEECNRPMDKQKIVEYLIHGGLTSILRSNLAGGKNQPRVWLCPDQLGNVTHTFVPERGVVGGQVVPSAALRENKIFTPKLDSVLSFIQSFGLDRREAEKVVSEVGTAP